MFLDKFWKLIDKRIKKLNMTNTRIEYIKPKVKF